jgi:hypothetical protein
MRNVDRGQLEVGYNASMNIQSLQTVLPSVTQRLDFHYGTNISNA